ncbi:MAG: hypothetical protein GY719_36405 [bacterium]|nr:hypothetical protein [bacterium]
MTDVVRSMIRFSWAMSLFGVRQAAEMMSALGTARSPRQATSAFDSISRVAAEQLGEGGLGDAFRTADRWQADLIDAVFGAVDPALDLSRGVASKTMLRGSLAMLRQSAAVLETAMPAGNRVMWRELRNKLEAFESFQYVEQILGTEPLTGGDPSRQRRASATLCDQIEKAEDSGPYLKLWLTEGLGFAFAEAAWDRGEPRGLLRAASLEPLPEESLIPLHTGMGLSLARRVLPDLEAGGGDLAAPLRSFARLCEDNARDGFAQASYEALGLIVRQLAPQLTNEVDRELARETSGPGHRDAFWHGLGRGLYFTATQALPGSLGRAVARVRHETSAGPARFNALAGLAWAVTLVNFRQPEVLEGFLNDGAFDEKESTAVSDGIAAAVLLWRDAVGEDSHLEAFQAHCAHSTDSAGERWRRLVTVPCDVATRDWSELKESSGPGAIFRVRGGD